MTALLLNRWGEKFMPKCGSQIILCDLPVRFDTYQGCSHNCQYCFTYNKYDIKNIKKYESIESLTSWIDGKRTSETSWCDWDIPLHWGGMSDPFQKQAELKHKTSYECLKIFSKTKYPFIVSTKSVLPVTDDYYSLFKNCNFVYQISMIDSELDNIEGGAPTFRERMNTIEKMSKIAKRVIIRIQPYFSEYHKQIIGHLKEYKELGVYGVILEGIKFKKKVKGMIRSGGDFVYPYKYLKRRFEEIKKCCHENGLVFLCGENRLRHISDSLCCCGVEGLEGFVYNKANLNHFLYDKENYIFTRKMQTASANVAKGIHQNTRSLNVLNKMTYKKYMNLCETDMCKIGIFKPQVLQK